MFHGGTRMSPIITIATSDVSDVRRELARMEAKRRGFLRLRGAPAAEQIRGVRIRLGAAMLEAMERGDDLVTLDLGEDDTYVDQALERVRDVARAH